MMNYECNQLFILNTLCYESFNFRKGNTTYKLGNFICLIVFLIAKNSLYLKLFEIHSIHKYIK